MTLDDLHDQLDEADTEFREGLKALYLSDLSEAERKERLSEIDQAYRARIFAITLHSIEKP